MADQRSSRPIESAERFDDVIRVRSSVFIEPYVRYFPIFVMMVKARHCLRSYFLAFLTLGPIATDFASPVEIATPAALSNVRAAAMAGRIMAGSWWIRTAA